MSRKKIGTFSPKVIEAPGLNIPAGTPIYISDSNIAHMKTSHPDDFKKYSADIETILRDLTIDRLIGQKSISYIE